MATIDTSNPDASASLLLAVVISSAAPIILLDRDLRIVTASTSFCSAFDIDPMLVAGQLLTVLGMGQWNVPQLISGLESAVSGSSSISGYELVLARPGGADRTLVIEAHRLDYGLGQDVRVMLSMNDVTLAKAAEKLKDRLMHDKATLMKELQHRVANSLQIIASVLMQSAKSSRSKETRGHLNDAHDRVMSVASLQRQLAVSNVDTVDLRTYFNDLCRSIGASMIRDRSRIKIDVTCDDSTTNAETSVSFGLIVTELVINGLKHAFPENRKGRIAVDYLSSDGDWTLTVSDDGIGMPDHGEDSKPGLGTSIVEALAKQLGAVITVTDSRPGTHVALEHLDIVDVAVPRLAMASR